MPRFTATIPILRFDGEKYTQACIDYLQQQMKLAGRDFAKVALARIPIRTGFVAGAFGTLTQLVGPTARLNPAVAFVRRVIARSRAFLSGTPKGRKLVEGEFYYPPTGGKILKTPTSGRQFATASQDIFKQEGQLLTFNYDIDITYLAINDRYSGHSPTAPWGAFEAGKQAFIDYMNNRALTNLPDIQQFIIVETIMV